MKSSWRFPQTRKRINALVAALRAIPRGRYVVIVAALFALVSLCSFVGAHALATWLPENLPVALGGCSFLCVTYRCMPLSRVSHTLIFGFFCLHEIGAYWTYAKVPYDDWWQSLFGVTLNSQLGFRAQSL